jgi:DeoR family transcriptional regulator, fructose operon transcriptional repressor
MNMNKMDLSDLLAHERQTKIVELINQRNSITVLEICDVFRISEATARRDLAKLASQNLLKRVHGGAVKHQTVATSEKPIEQRQHVNQSAKTRIAQHAVNLLNDGESLLLVGGSTGIAIAKELYALHDLTVITDSLIVANILLDQENHTVMMLGGVIDPDERAVRGSLPRVLLQKLQVDKAMLGTKGISVERGLSIESPEDAELWRTFTEIAHHVIVVADSSKFDQSALVRAIPIGLVDTLVTDDSLAPDLQEQLLDQGVYVIAV